MLCFLNANGIITRICTLQYVRRLLRMEIDVLPMKILFLAPANNYHTQKWCSYFVSRGYEVHVISFFPGTIEGVTVHFLDCGVDWQQPDRKKLKYLLKTPKIRRIVAGIEPDIISVHYATSYGTAAGIAGLKNYALSVWGGDVYTFPHKSPVHRMLLQYSLDHAACLLSTSAAMAREVGKYTDKKFYVTPFGVKTDLFSPEKRTREPDDEQFVIGTVKALKPKYGIDVLLHAAHLVKQQHPEIPVRLRIAGEGPCETEYRHLAETLGISPITDWLGFISQEEAAKEWANMDVAVVPSVTDSESFGVSAVEAEACEIPVIISDVPGLMEATQPGVTSIVVTRKSAQALADAIVLLYQNPDIRTRMGKAGRKLVMEKFDYTLCFRNIEKIFLELAENGKNKMTRSS